MTYRTTETRHTATIADGTLHDRRPSIGHDAMPAALDEPMKVLIIFVDSETMSLWICRYNEEMCSTSNKTLGRGRCAWSVHQW